jgi:predicted phage terminase large subunit-like protein
MSKQDTLNALLRQDFHAFVEKVFNTLHPSAEYEDNWHIRAMTYALNQCIEGETKRQMITLPPRSLKSICASVALPAWILGHNPSLQIICISHSQDLADNLSLSCRSIMEEAWYKAVFPQTRVNPLKNTLSDYITTQHGGRLATSVGGSLTGRGGDVIIVDDFHKADDPLSDAKRKSAIDWYSNTVPSRLNNKETGVIIVVQQRLHEADLVGVLEKQGKWAHLNLPAIAEMDEDIPIGPKQCHKRTKGDLLHPERESATTLDDIRSSLGSITFSAQYQQTPVSLDGNIIKMAWLNTFTGKLYRYNHHFLVQSWDTANTTSQSSDYSVCTTWLVAEKGCYLVDVFRDKLEYPDLLAKVYELDDHWKPDLVLVEQCPGSQALIQTVQKERGTIRYLRYRPDTDKTVRLLKELPTIESGLVHIPEDRPFFASYINELKAFPNGINDDQVDSTTMFLFWYRTYFNPSIQPFSGTTVSEANTLNVTVTSIDHFPDLDLNDLY